MTLRLASTERNTNRMAWDDTERDGTRWVGIRPESIAGLWQDKRAVPEMFAEPSQPFGTYYLRMPLRETVLLVLMREDELTAFRNYFRPLDGNDRREVSNKPTKRVVCLLLRYSSVR
ncbi:hypothetical protein G5I_01938 [Acromyrmex echinatior]|uniref:Uncharacterized protein n=1 Tax=Acromyrmex echinatior TaxID=103372 RepID=F4W8Z4_ACREC|nr:hypothetical protein G5I_01938 [Acromyrmex echinatior]